MSSAMDDNYRKHGRDAHTVNTHSIPAGLDPDPEGRRGRRREYGTSLNVSDPGEHDNSSDNPLSVSFREFRQESGEIQRCAISGLHGVDGPGYEDPLFRANQVSHLVQARQIIRFLILA
jgi:hypothetical protein